MNRKLLVTEKQNSWKFNYACHCKTWAAFRRGSQLQFELKKKLRQVSWSFQQSFPIYIEWSTSNCVLVGKCAIMLLNLNSKNQKLPFSKIISWSHIQKDKRMICSQPNFSSASHPIDKIHQDEFFSMPEKF